MRDGGPLPGVTWAPTDRTQPYPHKAPFGSVQGPEPFFSGPNRPGGAASRLLLKSLKAALSLASIRAIAGAASAGLEARQQHVGASADLNQVADEIVQVARLMGGYQRVRYARAPERLAACLSGNSVAGSGSRQ